MYQIAGSRTADNWRVFKQRLDSADVSVWQQAFDHYFNARLSSRYLEPLAALQKDGRWRGEGFTITSIQCVLIEFLASTLAGKNYRFVRRGDPPLGPFEYSKSRDLFVRFLSRENPFARDFSPATADEFYVGIRCGLLHEAQTKNGWRIWAGLNRGTSVNPNTKMVFRNALQARIMEYIDRYHAMLLSDAAVQKAFIRKFDSICA